MLTGKQCVVVGGQTALAKCSFGLSPVEILQMEAGEEHFPITLPVSQPGTENVQTGQAVRFPVRFC